MAEEFRTESANAENNSDTDRSKRIVDLSKKILEVCGMISAIFFWIKCIY